MLKIKKVEEALFFLTILFLPTQLGRHFWPDFSFVYSLPIDYLSPTLYFWDILVVLLLSVFLINKKKVSKIALNLLFIFILAQSFSLISSEANLGAGLVRLEQYLVAGIFGVYLASQDFTKLKKAIFYPLSFSIIFQSLVSICQFLTGGTLGLWILGERNFTISTPGIAKFDFYGRDFLRPYATFPHPNVLSAFLLVGAILNTILKQGEKLVKMSLLLSTITIILTFSRVGILISFISGLILLKKRWRILLIIAGLFLSPVLFTRFFSILSYDNLSFLRREQLSFSALSSFFSNPFLGVGLNNFIPHLADQLVAGPSRFLQPVHNIILLSLAETGVVGFLGLIILIAYPIFKLFGKKERSIFLILWLIIIFLGLFDHYFLTLPQGYRLLFLVWGLTLSMLRTSA